MHPFEDLNGYSKNLTSAHETMAKAYAKSVLVKNSNVLGVVLMGGAARGYADELSEIDLAIFVIRKMLDGLPKGEHRWQGYLFDNDIRLYSQEAKSPWTQERRQALSEGKILLDRRGLIRKLLRRKLRFVGDERRDIILENLLFLKDRIESAETIWPKTRAFNECPLRCEHGNRSSAANSVCLQQKILA